MTADVPPTLVEWARLPGPAKVLAKARQRLEEGHGQNGRPLRVDLTGNDRSDLGRLLGSAWALSNRPVRLQALADAIASLGCDLESLLHVLHGPVRDRPAERVAARAAADAERRAAQDELTRAGIPDSAAEAWLASRGLPQAGSGRLRQLAARVASVLRHLPCRDDTVLLPVLAATALHNPHALDRGSRVGGAVLRIAAPCTEDPEQSEAEAWRSAWESLGVVCDELSSRVLVLNLPLNGTAAACRLTAAAASEPVWLTWRSLTGAFVTGQPKVFVCENPAVLAAAADRLGSQSRPLICTNGRPSGAARRLIAGIAANPGTQLWVRADDDQAGQQIVAELCAIAPTARPWQYQQRTLGGAPARYEEQDLDLLLSDLRADAQGAATSSPES